MHNVSLFIHSLFVLLIIFRFALFLLTNHSPPPLSLVLHTECPSITRRLTLVSEIHMPISSLSSTHSPYPPPHLTMLPLLHSMMHLQPIATQNGLSKILLSQTFILVCTTLPFLRTSQPLLLAK